MGHPIPRRQLLKAAAAIPLLPGAALLRCSAARAEDGASKFSRVRPGDAAWPSEESWNKLGRAVEGRLIKVNSPLSACREAPGSPACAAVFKALRNPYYIGDHTGLTQTSGWIGAWTSRPSVYAVAARKTDDVVAAVNFARENKLRLVVKGGGHSYQGTSCAADSLLVWTREMNAISLHEAFVGQGCEEAQPPQPAVSVGAGTLWLAAYDAVTTRAGRYVQGGGCVTVGVAGLTIPTASSPSIMALAARNGTPTDSPDSPLVDLPSTERFDDGRLECAATADASSLDRRPDTDVLRETVATDWPTAPRFDAAGHSVQRPDPIRIRHSQAIPCQQL